MKILLSQRWLASLIVLPCMVGGKPITGPEADFAAEDIIERDLCVLGGGGSGVYGAIRAKDLNHSVIVVEKNDYLGGHSETIYVDQGEPLNYGVEGVFNDEVSRDYLKRLGVDWQSLVPATLDTEYVDFQTGKKAAAPGGLLETVVGATLYRAAIQKYTHLQQGPYLLSYPVEEELLAPFGDFVEKNHLEGALQAIFMFAHNLGDLLKTPLLYVIQTFGVPQIDALLEGYITPKNGMAEVYNNAAKVLGEDLLLQTTALQVNRTDAGATLIVENNNGRRKLIKAKKLLITFPPLLSSLNGFDLDETETQLFKKWVWKSYYVAVINNTGIPNGVNIANVDPNSGTGNLPDMPFQWQLQYLGPTEYLTSKIVASPDFTEQDARDLVINDIRRMGTAGTYDINSTPHIIKFGSHSPAALSVSNEDVRGGFYANLYDLQGKRSTYYSGLSFCQDYSSVLWAYTKNIVDQMFQGDPAEQPF